MLFSLIVPVYNTKQYLDKCLESIEIQDFDDYELILIDDGSTDGAGDICENFCAKFNAVQGRNNFARVIHQENRGLSGARNRGIEEAKGEWIWFIDSDDFIVPGALSSMHERMRYAKGDMYAFQYIRTDERGENPEEIFFRAFQNIVRIKGEGDLLWNYDHRILPYKEGWESCTRLYNREIINRFGISFKDTRKVFAEDLCFMIDYMMCIRSAVMLVNYYYYYRQRETSIMKTLDQKTVIPRLVNMLESNYFEAKRLKKRQTVKNFDTLCLGVLRTHIHKLDALSNEEIKKEIINGANSRYIGRYIKKAESILFEEIEKRKHE